MRPPWRESRRRRAAWVALIFVVLLAHLLFGLRVLASVIGWNTGARPKRIEISFSQQLKPTAPPEEPAAAPAPPPAPRPAYALRVARASSQAAPASAAEADARAQLDAEAVALAARLDDEQRARDAIAHAAAASEAAAASAAASTPVPAVAAPVVGPPRPPFQWPPSTRLSYTLTGERNGGKLYGNAVVEWRREGARYQVQFDIHITPMIDQQMSSEGLIGADGLEPSHYEEAFSVPFLEPRVRKVEIGDTEVTLNNGNRVAKLPQTQDGASQFVQFVWMFYSHPEYLGAGNVVQIPLALAHNLRRWNYIVMGRERLDLAFGGIDAVHLKPLLDGPRRANEYPFEIWTAPSLQYLPVQILVKIDEKTWALLSLDDLPLQAAGERPPPPPRPAKPFPDPPSVGER